ncbi:unnamed protein product [Adineta steineri]|uniref:SH3 domain-containing protein n=1 Tax=Adineta steineri TaxID=433720 RepID=A0A813PQK1_9BILA|nr:unnamed protein product [Adineta steineri]
MNHEWWQGYLAGGNESGYVPDGYIKLKARRRDSAPIQNHPPLSITPDPSSSLNSINLTATSSIDQLDAPMVYRPPSDLSLVDEHRLNIAKETEIVEVDSDIDDEDDEDEEEDDSQENTYENTSSSSQPKPPPHRAIYDILPPSPPIPQSTIDHCQSRSSTSSSSRLTSTNEQQIIDIDTALREVLSGIRTVEECHAQCFRSIPPTNNQQDERLTTPQETDAPDLVLNLPISSGFITPPATKSLDTNLNENQLSKSSSSSNSSPIHQSIENNNNNNHNSLTQSTIVNDSTRTSRSNSSSTPTVHFIEKLRPSPEPTNRKKIPPPIMKKPEKTVELLKRLGLQPSTESSCSVTISSTSTSSSTSSHLHQQPIPAAGSSKTTDV